MGDFSVSDELNGDKYDPHSLHFIAENSHNKIIGTVRLILHSDVGFRIENYIDSSSFKDNYEAYGEISRLIILKNYRNNSKLLLGLFKQVYQYSKRHKLTHWYILVEKKLMFVLKRFGFLFHQVAPDVETYTTKIPCVGTIDEIEQILLKNRPNLSKEFLDGLEQTFQPCLR